MNQTHIAAALAVGLAVAPLGLLAQNDSAKATKKAAPPGNTKPAAVAPANPAPSSGSLPLGKESTALANQTEEKAIRASGEAYVKAFNQHDPVATADFYTSDTEYIDERGVETRGRSSIEAVLKGYFAANPGCRLELTVLSIRVIAPNVAIEDGLTTIIPSKDATPVTTRYTAVHSKVAANWLLASVRDSSFSPQVENRTRMSQFEWMQGEWVHEGTDATILFDCYPIANGNYLIRDFTIHFAGHETITGSQRIGWDAQAGKYKSWIFDSDGSFAEGYWHRDGDAWVLKTTGITAKGQSASSTTIYSFENAHTMTFQSTDHEIAGQEFSDTPPVKIVRRPPRPD